MESALERALNDSSSPVYKSNNWKSIQRYLKPKGIIIPKDDILRYLEKQKFSEVRYKNEGLQKVSQLGKQHATRAKFFSIMQADVLVLSKKKQYGTRIKYVLGAIFQLSRYIFLEPCYSLKFDAHKKAWDSIISRMKSVLPHANIDTITCDSGVEFSNLSIKKLFQDTWYQAEFDSIAPLQNEPRRASHRVSMEKSSETFGSLHVREERR